MELLDEGKIKTGAYAIRRNGDVITFYYINGILHYSCSSYGTWRYSEVYGSNGDALIREQYKADIMAVYDKPKLVDGKPVIGEPIWKRGIEWDKVPVDTKILVRNYDDDGWGKRYFAEYKNGKVYAFDGGMTSWNCATTVGWMQAKLAEEVELA